ncbi:hypothetical protein DV737_g959, partial [Chaetothyriales sp. CBS 132003]
MASTEEAPPLESAIAEHLRVPRTVPSRMPEEYTPAFPAFVARFPESVKDIVMAIIGSQHANAHKAEEVGALTKILSFMDQGPETSPPRHLDLASVTDAVGAYNQVVIAYWDNISAFQDWNEASGFAEWWKGLDPMVESHGWFQEVFLPSIDRYETIYSDPMEGHTPEGAGALSTNMSGMVKEHVYWGSMRDRLPVSQVHELVGKQASEVSLPDDTTKARVRVPGKQNLAVIRSGQDWSRTLPEEHTLYLETLHPVLTEGLTAIVTGGASGIGETYVKHLTKAGAFVVFGDVNDQGGQRVESEAGGATKSQFVHTDVTVWEEQLGLFKRALSKSPRHRIDIVIANAGVSGFDDVFHSNPDAEDPDPSSLHIAKTNGLGVLYTTKLALHYFRRQFKQHPAASADQLLILQGSLAGYVDLRGAPQYAFSKYGSRGLMKSLRRTEHVHNIRVNYVAPAYIKTPLLSAAVVEHLEKAGTEFATLEDAARAVLKLASDSSINGYVDVDVDDYREGHLKEWSDAALGMKARELSEEQQKVAK